MYISGLVIWNITDSELLADNLLLIGFLIIVGGGIIAIIAIIRKKNNTNIKTQIRTNYR